MAARSDAHRRAGLRDATLPRTITEVAMRGVILVLLAWSPLATAETDDTYRLAVGDTYDTDPWDSDLPPDSDVGDTGVSPGGDTDVDAPDPGDSGLSAADTDVTAETGLPYPYDQGLDLLDLLDEPGGCACDARGSGAGGALALLLVLAGLGRRCPRRAR